MSGVYRINRRYNNVGRVNVRKPVSGGGGIMSPLDITGCEYWLDFSDVSTMYTDAGITNVSSNNDLIYRINNKGELGCYAEQTSLAARPVYKTNVQNGLSVGQSQDTSDFLDLSYHVFTEFTMFFVLLTPASLTNYDRWIGYTTSYIRHQSGGRISVRGSLSGDIVITDSGALQANSQYIQSVTYDGLNYKIYDNGEDITLGTPQYESDAWGLYYLWSISGYGLPSSIGSWLLYDTALSDTDRQSVETYLNNKWAIY